MEVIICEDAAQIGTLAADAIEALLTRKPAAVLGLATGSSPLAIYDELAARCRRGAITFAPGAGLHPRRVRRAARRPSRALPQRHRQGVRLPRRLRSWRGGRPGRVGQPTSRRLCAAYEAAIAAGRRGRPADPRDRHRRPHRLQRAGFLARLPDPDQDADPADPDRQRPLLRRRRRRGARRTA